MTVIYLGKSGIEAFRVFQPVQDVLDVFSTQSSTRIEKMIAKRREFRTLAHLRDTLLPRLLSGELDVSEAEREVEIAK